MPAPAPAPQPNNDEERIRQDEESAKALKAVQNADKYLPAIKKVKVTARAGEQLEKLEDTEDMLDQEENEQPGGFEIRTILTAKSRAQPRRPAEKKEEPKKDEQEPQKGQEQELDKAKPDETKPTDEERKPPQQPEQEEPQKESSEQERQRELVRQQQQDRLRRQQDLRDRYQKMQKARRAKAGEKGVGKAGKEAAKGVERKAGKEVGKEAGKQVARQGAKQAIRAGLTEAGEGLTAAATSEIWGPILIVAAVFILFVLLVVVIIAVMRGTCGSGLSSALDNSAICNGVSGLGSGVLASGGAPGRGGGNGYRVTDRWDPLIIKYAQLYLIGKLPDTSWNYPCLVKGIMGKESSGNPNAVSRPDLDGKFDINSPPKFGFLWTDDPSHSNSHAFGLMQITIYPDQNQWQDGNTPSRPGSAILPSQFARQIGALPFRHYTGLILFNPEYNVQAGVAHIYAKIMQNGGNVQQGVIDYYGRGKPKPGEPTPEQYLEDFLNKWYYPCVNDNHQFQ